MLNYLTVLNILYKVKLVLSNFNININIYKDFLQFYTFFASSARPWLNDDVDDWLKRLKVSVVFCVNYACQCVGLSKQLRAV